MDISSLTEHRDSKYQDSCKTYIPNVVANLFSCIAFHPNGHLIATAQTSGKSSLAVQQQSHVQVHLTIVYTDFPQPKLSFLVIRKIVEYAVTQIQRLSIKCICHTMWDMTNFNAETLAKT